MEETTLEYNQCEEAIKRLDDYLSRELTPEEEERVTSHLAECRGCFDQFHFEENLLATIRQKVAQVNAPNSLREKILDLVHGE
jgi:anti-sigma factor (TIGR02949 family)